MLLNGIWKNTAGGHVIRAERDEDGMYDVTWLFIEGRTPNTSVGKYTPAELIRKIKAMALKKEEIK